MSIDFPWFQQMNYCLDKGIGSLEGEGNISWNVLWIWIAFFVTQVYGYALTRWFVRSFVRVNQQEIQKLVCVTSAFNLPGWIIILSILKTWRSRSSELWNANRFFHTLQSRGTQQHGMVYGAWIALQQSLWSAQEESKNWIIVQGQRFFENLSAAHREDFLASMSYRLWLRNQVKINLI